MPETHETILSSLFNALELDPEHILNQEEGDCCPICLEDIFSHQTEKSCLFVCCGKRLCKNCFINNNTIISRCPMCRHELPKNSTETTKLIQKNSILGKAWAQHRLALYFDSTVLDRTDPSIQKNDNEAFRLYLLSAKQGFIDGQCNLCLMYLEGRGCEKSTKEFSYWLTLAANQGSIEAHVSLGIFILEGAILGRSREDGVILLQYAATYGIVQAQCRLAQELVDSDVQTALFWYKKAAFKNNLMAQYNLSILLFRTNQDIPTAMCWLRKAAGSGDIDAKKLLQKKEIEIALKCGSCFKSLDGKGKKCTKCKSVYYCNKECQVNDWKRHKKECVDEISE